MSSTSSDFTQKGIAAVKVGNLSLARQLLNAALVEDPNDVQAWLWMSGIVHTPAEKRQCLRRVLEIDPANAAAKRGLEALGPEPAAAFVADSARPQVSDPVHAATVERKDDAASRQAAAPPDRWSNLLTVALFIAVILLLVLILSFPCKSGIIRAGWAHGDTPRMRLYTRCLRPAQRGRAASFPATLWQSLIVGLALSVIALFACAGPHDALVKADVIGFATCHRIPERSLHVDGHQLPLCARCTGIYIGMLTGWLWLIAGRRTHAAQLPARPIVVALLGFVALMGIDGLNSTAMLTGLPHPYETENWMRVFTGSLYGLAISLLVTPLITVMLWREPTGERTLKGWGELLLLVNVTAVMVMAVMTEASFLLWPLVAVSVVGVMGLMTLMNLSIVATLAGKANTYAGWRDLVAPGLVGISLALVEFTGIGLLRAGLL